MALDFPKRRSPAQQVLGGHDGIPVKCLAQSVLAQAYEDFPAERENWAATWRAFLGAADGVRGRSPARPGRGRRERRYQHGLHARHVCSLPRPRFRKGADCAARTATVTRRCG